MSIRFIGTVWDSGLYDGPRLLMMLALADHADDDGWCFPNYETLAHKIRRNVKTVYRVLGELESEGALRRLDGRIGIVEPEILEEVQRRAEASNPKPDAPKRPRKILNSEKSDLNSENSVLTIENEILISENQILKNEKEILKNEKPFYIDPSINRQSNQERGNGAVAPAPTPAASPQFQDVPEEVKRQKRRARVDELLAPAETPAAFAQAPPVMALLHRLTGYWPGENKRDELIRQLGEQPDEAALTRAVTLWNLAGHKPTNFLGICEWYQEILRDPEWTPGKRFINGKVPKAAAPAVVMKEIEPGLY